MVTLVDRAKTAGTRPSVRAKKKLWDKTEEKRPVQNVTGLEFIVPNLQGGEQMVLPTCNHTTQLQRFGSTNTPEDRISIPFRSHQERKQNDRSDSRTRANETPCLNKRARHRCRAEVCLLHGHDVQCETRCERDTSKFFILEEPAN